MKLHLQLLSGLQFLNLLISTTLLAMWFRTIISNCLNLLCSNFQTRITVSFAIETIKKICLVTISCDIRLTPKQEIDDYNLNYAYGSCTNPPRNGNGRKKRSEAEETHLTISATQRISQEETNQQVPKETIQQNSFTVNIISSVILLLFISV